MWLPRKMHWKSLFQTVYYLPPKPHLPTFRILTWICLLAKKMNEDLLRENNKGYLLRTCYHRESAIIPYLGSGSKAGRELKVYYGGGGGKNCQACHIRYVIIGSCWHGDVEGGLTRREASHVIGWGNISAFLWLGPKLKSGTKIKEAGLCWPSPGCLGPIIAKAVVSLPKLVAVEVVSQGFIFIFDPVIGHVIPQALSQHLTLGKTKS